MKNIKIFLLIVIINLLSGCTEVIHLDLDSAPTRLVVDASIIQNQKGENPAKQTISLSKTAGYYDNIIPRVSGAIVQIIQVSNGTVFNFIEETDYFGKYVCDNFVPIENETYKLTVTYDNETYTSTEIFKPDNSSNEDKDLEDAGGGFFKPPQRTVRGNIVNNTNHGNYCLGDFRFFRSYDEYKKWVDQKN